MAWRLAPAIKQARSDADRLAPNRNKASDGTIGNAAHRSRTSDHNPDAQEYVCAWDGTNSPSTGWACASRIFEMLRHPACKYVIWDHHIYYPDWELRDGKRVRYIGHTKRRYGGSNPHDKHAHLSVTQAGKLLTTPWFGAASPGPQPAPPSDRKVTMEISEQRLAEIMEQSSAAGAARALRDHRMNWNTGHPDPHEKVVDGDLEDVLGETKNDARHARFWSSQAFAKAEEALAVAQRIAAKVGA